MNHAERDRLDNITHQLSQLDATPCYFKHEDSELEDPPLCSNSIRDRRLGCAHADNPVIIWAIEQLQDIGVLSPETASLYSGAIESNDRVLLTLDVQAYHDYNDGRELLSLTDAERSFPVSLPVINGQQEIIDRRVEIRDLLLEAIRQHG